MSTGGAPESVLRFAVELDRQVRSVVGDRLVATILHGSAALGGFVPDRSDVDVLMLIDPSDISAEVLQVLAEQIHVAADGCPGVGLELSLVSTATAARPDPPWPFLLHVATRVVDAKTVVGIDHEGDPDLLMHYAVCRAAGIAVTGPPPDQLIGEIGRDQILGYLRSELAWAGQHADPTYGVLNACRAWQFAVTGELVSKLDGASWALDIGGPEGVIASAVASQTSSADGPQRRDADRLIGEVRALIAVAATQPR
jgi:streptomycin 3"-adenylyltransferase